MSYQQGSLRPVQRKEGRVWYFRYRIEKHGERVENTKRIGLVSELKTESAAWKKVDEMGLRAEINKDCAEAMTFGVMALRYLDKEPHDDAVVYYVKKVMIPVWGNTMADDIKRRDVRDWLKALKDDGTYSGPTTGKIKGIMHAVYEYGLFEEQVTSNPCDGWRLKGVEVHVHGNHDHAATDAHDPAILHRSVVLRVGVHRGSHGTSCKRSDRTAMGRHHVG